MPPCLNARCLSLAAMICLIFGSVFTSFVFAADPPESADRLMAALRTLKPAHFCGEPVPLDRQEVRERMEKELLLMLWDRPQVILWLKRTKRFFPHIEKVLKQNGMPEDLKYVAVAESALLPNAGSYKGAVGFWQFMGETGRKFGLEITEGKDERRSLEASTEAAARYLKRLYGMFNSWTLAVASYNMGEDGLAAEMLEQESRDYYRLFLPQETQRFLFRILTIKLILSEPEKFGFHLSEDDYYTPVPVEEVRLDCPRETPLRIVARAANTDYKTIRDLNPEIRGRFLPQGSHRILVPRGSGKDFHAHFQSSQRDFKEGAKDRTYVVQKGDSLTVIADRFNVPLASLLIWNRLDLSRPIHPGDRLVVLAGDGAKAAETNGEDPGQAETAKKN